MRDTAVVILNWNGLPMLQTYLPMLVARTKTPGAFIVVADNGSTDGSVEWLAANHPEIRLICLDRNYGFTGGYNRALLEIDADYYFRFYVCHKQTSLPCGIAVFSAAI